MRHILLAATAIAMIADGAVAQTPTSPAVAPAAGELLKLDNYIAV